MLCIVSDSEERNSPTGWDTDQFLTDPTVAALIGLTIIKNVRYSTLSQTELVALSQ